MLKIPATELLNLLILRIKELFREQINFEYYEMLRLK